MAGPTIGRAEIHVDFDGGALPVQAKQLAAKAGKDAGFAFTDTFQGGLNGWSKALATRMGKAGKLSSGKLSTAIKQSLRRELAKTSQLIADAVTSEDGFKRFAKSVGGAEEAVKQLNQALTRSAETGDLSRTSYKQARAGIQRWANAVLAGERAAEAARKASEAAARAAKKASEDARAAAEEESRSKAKLREETARLRAESDRLTGVYKELNLHLGNQKNWDLLVKNSDDAGASYQRLVDSVRELNAAGKITNTEMAVMFNRMKELSAGNDDAVKPTERLTKALERQTNVWRRLSSNTRQWTLIVAAVAAGGQQIATLGSALGPGLLTVGAALTQIGIAGGVTIAVFKNLGGEISKLRPEVRDAATAYQSLGKAFDRLQDDIQVAALEHADDAFRSMQKTVEALTPAFLKVGKAVGRVIDSFAKGIAPGTRAFANLEKLIGDSGATFEKVAAIAGTFGRALLNVFASPAMERALSEFLGGLDSLGAKFEAFTSSSRLDTWFARASAIFGAFGRLLEATGSALAGLVDAQSVDNLTRFLDHLTGFMPALGRLLDILGELDVFGLLAQALDDVGGALAPLAAPLGELFDAVNRIVSIAIDEWAGNLGGAAGIAAPLVQALADALGSMSPGQIRGLADAFTALAAASLVLAGGKGLGKLAGVLKGILPLLTGLFAKGKGGAIAGALGGSLVGGINQAGNEAESTAAFVGGKIGDSLLGALTGFFVGGPWGALAGFVVAGVASTLSDTEALIENWTIPVFGEKVGAKVRESLASFGEGDVTGGLAQYSAAIGIWAEELVANIGGWLAPIGAAIAAPFAAIGQVFADMWNGVIAGLTGFFSWWVGFWTAFFAPVWAVLAPVAAAFAAAWQGMVDTFATIWNGLVAIFQGIWLIFSSIISLGVQTIAFLWNTAWSAVASFFTGIWNQIVAFAGPIVAALVAAIRGPLAAVAAWWNGLWSGVSSTFAGIWNGMVRLISPIVSSIVRVLRSAFDGISSWWRGLWSGVGSFFSSIWGGIEATARSAINGIIDILNGILDPIRSVADALKSLSGGAINVNIPSLPGMATGGITAGPTLAGEAGREMVIPLTGPLSQINPTVRPFAEVIREGGSGGGIAGTGRVVNVAEGAIVVNTIAPPMQVASAILDRLVASAVG